MNQLINDYTRITENTKQNQIYELLCLNQIKILLLLFTAKDFQITQRFTLFIKIGKVPPIKLNLAL